MFRAPLLLCFWFLLFGAAQFSWRRAHLDYHGALGIDVTYVRRATRLRLFPSRLSCAVPDAPAAPRSACARATLAEVILSLLPRGAVLARCHTARDGTIRGCERGSVLT